MQYFGKKGWGGGGGSRLLVSAETRCIRAYTCDVPPPPPPPIFLKFGGPQQKGEGLTPRTSAPRLSWTVQYHTSTMWKSNHDEDEVNAW